MFEDHEIHLPAADLSLGKPQGKGWGRWGGPAGHGWWVGSSGGCRGSRQQDGQCSYPLQRVGPGTAGAARGPGPFSCPP